MRLYRRVLFLAVVWFGVSGIAPSSYADDLPPICASAMPTVLIGPFTVSGATRSNLDAEVGNIIAYTIVALLFDSRELAVMPWNPGFRGFESRQLSDLTELLGAPLSYESTPERTDKEGFRRIGAIANALRTRGCDYLFGGSIFFDASTISISTYLLNSRTAEISRRAGASSFDRATSLGQVIASLTERLRRELQPSFLPQRKFEIGCLRLSSGPQTQTQIDSSKIATAKMLSREIQQGILEVLRQKTKNFRSQFPDEGICQSPEAEFVDSNSFALFTGEISLSESANTLTPRIRMNVRDGDRLRSVPITLMQADLDPSKIASVERSYFEQIRLFFEALGESSLALLELTNLNFQIDEAEQFSKFKLFDLEATDPPDADAYLILGYKLLSRELASPLSFSILGVAFLQKGKWELAIASLSRAMQLAQDQIIFLNSSAASPVRADAIDRDFFVAHCWELLASAQLNAGFADDAGLSLAKARAQFKMINDPKGVGRVNRISAKLTLRTQGAAKAIQQLKEGSVDQSDYRSLLLLGTLEASKGNLDEALTTLDAVAVQMDRSDSPARIALGDAYEAIGDQLLDKKEQLSVGSWILTQASFEKALEAREAQSSRYKLAYAIKASGDLAKAENIFRLIANSPKDENDIRWIEAAWLELLETDLLLGRFDYVVERSSLALDVLRGPLHDDARLVVKYISLLASSLSVAPLTPREQLLKELQQLEFRQIGSVSNLNWSSDQIDQLISDPQRFLNRDHPFTTANLDIIRSAQKFIRDYK
jgi:tetratricopeptide (TPR) repeat protein